MATMKLRNFLCAAALCCAWWVATAADPAFARVKHLQHGINASIWFAQHPADYSVERLRSFTTTDDIHLMARMGFDHVRLSIDPEPLAAAFQSQDEGSGFLKELDRVVKEVNGDGMAIILDVHPEGSYKATLKQGNEGVERFAMLWREMATHYRESDPKMVFFELMNEPEQEDLYRWQGIQAYVAQQVRAIAPDHTIIASAARWDGLEDLLHLQPLAINNVIYTFHDYEPFPFTHQGATWTSAEVRPLKNVPYPATREGIEKNMEQEPTLSGRFYVKQYELDHWDRHRIEETVHFAKLWSQQYNAPVYCGEFGVHLPVADPKMRAQWIEDTRKALEQNDVGWAMWDYQTNFGVVKKQDGKTVPDPLVVKALGLKEK